MQVLGHKNIKNTLLYTQLVTVGEDKGYVCKIAKTPEEALVLIEDGFEIHDTFNNGETKPVSETQNIICRMHVQKLKFCRMFMPKVWSGAEGRVWTKDTR